MKMYKYGYRLRPPALNTEPKGYKDWEGFPYKIKGYWGFVFYDRKLSKQETFDYDLDFIEEEE